MRARHAARTRGLVAWAVLAATLSLAPAPAERGGPIPPRDAAGREMTATQPMPGAAESRGPALPVAADLASGVSVPSRKEFLGSAQTVAVFALLSLAPAALLMVTAFVRISIVLTLLRQALGSPQVPGNQVLAALALLLTLLVMRPVADEVYTKGVEPYLSNRSTPGEAWKASSQPVKRFMLDQIYRTRHEHYLRELYDQIEPPSAGRVEPTDGEQLDLRVVAPAFLLSELTTALMIGFAIYLPFLVIDLVVSAVLAAMGLFMMPPSLVALPLKLVVFVLADGWMLVAGMLLRSFSQGP
jgi:flagellar biosynthesis protein FliP